MKKLILLLALIVSTTVDAQTSEISPISVGIGHINPTGDTLFVLKEMYPIMDTIWNLPININEKPVLIPVESIIALKSSYRRED